MCIYIYIYTILYYTILHAPRACPGRGGRGLSRPNECRSHPHGDVVMMI